MDKTNETELQNQIARIEFCIRKIHELCGELGKEAAVDEVRKIITSLGLCPSSGIKWLFPTTNQKVRDSQPVGRK